MAKKGGVQQLQADLQTDEDFEKFIQRPGLLVVDIYSEWCGPCIGMVGSLRKIKLEVGGDNLHLAIAKSDTISYLERFRNKSEPTWMFITQSKAINLMFGTNVPKLLKIIMTELELLNSTNEIERPTYEITELHPEELLMNEQKAAAIEEALRAEMLEQRRQRREYLMHVTNIIMENMPDMGISMFGPHVNREMFKRIMEPADVLKLQCKDRKVTAVSKENFDIVNFACTNPLSKEIINYLDQKDLLLCFWKVEDGQNVVELMNKLADELTLEKIEPPDDLNLEERIVPPILNSKEIIIEVAIKSDNDVVEDALKNEDNLDILETKELFEEIEENQQENELQNVSTEIPILNLDANLESKFEEDSASKTEESGTEAATAIEEAPAKLTKEVTLTIPAVWIPNDERTHAALIYVFFRIQTAPFLPADPEPEPPCVVMAFDAYKKRDLVGLADRHSEDVPFYGFFTSDNADEAKFIARTAEKYATMPHATTDKIVFKINKQTSHAMLNFAAYGPSYVSPNTVIGAKEAKKFFPENYQRLDAEDEPTKAEEAPKRKRKGKKLSTTSSQQRSTTAATTATTATTAIASGAATANDDATETEAATTGAGAQINEDGEEYEETGVSIASGEEDDSGDSLPPSTADEQNDATATNDTAANDVEENATKTTVEVETQAPPTSE